MTETPGARDERKAGPSERCPSSSSRRPCPPSPGIGPWAVALAIGLRSVGTPGTLEAIETSDAGPLGAISAAGGRWVSRVPCGMLPLVVPTVVGYRSFRSEINVRSSAVLGLFGAGGPGGELVSQLNLRTFEPASAVLLTIIAMVLAIDTISGLVRRRHRRVGAPDPRRSQRHRGPRPDGVVVSGRRRPIGLLLAGSAVLLACGGDDTVEPLRSYEMRLHIDDAEERYRYVADDPVDVRVGDEVTFQVTNTGALPHDLQVVGPGDVVLGVAPPVVSGGVITLTVHFAEPGRFALRCLVDDHLTTHGMQSIIEVSAT